MMGMTNSSFVLAFGDPRCRAVGLSGGKGASLAAMVQRGMPVPPGFVVTSAAFVAAVDERRLRECCGAGDLPGARKVVAAAKPPAALIAEHYAALHGPIAVRSSACAEDSEAASYAGQQSTYLNVEGLPTALDMIVECWLSFFSDRAVFYRTEKGSMDDIAMAVIVQQMVESKKSGVLFTADPVHGRKDRIVVEAAFGLGENVVDGEKTPDHYALDRKGTIKRSTIVGTQVLDEAELKRLAEMGRKLEEIYGCPQDIEWAFDGSGELFLLQSRPITTI
jgi:pyruvate, water dikinase